MKKYTIIFSFIFLLILGCSSSSVSLRGNIGEDIKPFMERTPEEEKIEIMVPVYKF